MRIHKSFLLSDVKAFKEKLLLWSQQFYDVVWLDSNDFTQLNSEYDAVLAVDAFTSIQTDYFEAFDKLKEYFFMFSLSDQTKDDIAQQVIQDNNFNKLYWVQLILSCVIATLGLLTNSIPVVI